MADTTIRIQRWDNGQLVEDYTVPKPLAQYNEETLLERAAAALSANKSFIDTPNASITQAQALVQIKALTRQVNGLIRLQLRSLDSVEDS